MAGPRVARPAVPRAPGRGTALALALALGCGPRAAPRRPEGAIAGRARDLASGAPIAHATLELYAAGGDGARARTATDDDGWFALDWLAPGTYALRARFAGHELTVDGIAIAAGAATAVDLELPLDRVTPSRRAWTDAPTPRIERHPSRDPRAHLEGTVTDTATGQRVAGAVVTVVGEGGDRTLQTVSDDVGRFGFSPVAPGTYAVSAYYSVSGRGQLEVVRNGVVLGAAEAVDVPLWLDLAR